MSAYEISEAISISACGPKFNNFLDHHGSVCSVPLYMFAEHRKLVPLYMYSVIHKTDGWIAAA